MENRLSNQRYDIMFKWTALTIGTLFGVAHIGILGHLINRPGVPVINLPVGDYTSYSVEASRDGYKIDYSSNDPKVIGKKKTVDKENGFLGVGGRTTVITDEEYTICLLYTSPSPRDRG